MYIQLKGMHIFLDLNEPLYLSRKGKSKSIKPVKVQINATIELPNLLEYSDLRLEVTVNHLPKMRATKNAIKSRGKSVKVIKTKKVVIRNKCGTNERREHIHSLFE